MNLEYFFFYSPFATMLQSIFNTVLLTSIFGTMAFALYWLLSPFFRKMLFPKAQKQVLSFLLLLFFLPYQVFLIKISSYLQIVGNHVEWTPEMYEKATHDMWKSANPSHFNLEKYIPNHYQVMIVLSYIWLVVMGILTAKGLYSSQKSQKYLKKYLEPICDQDVLEVYLQCSEKMGKKIPLNFLLTLTSTPLC